MRRKSWRGKGGIGLCRIGGKKMVVGEVRNRPRSPSKSRQHFTAPCSYR